MLAKSDIFFDLGLFHEHIPHFLVLLNYTQVIRVDLVKRACVRNAAHRARVMLS
jgi:hypothetical protein